MKIIQLAVLLFSFILFSSHIYAQRSESRSTPLKKLPSAPDELKLDVTDSSLSATFQDKTLPVSNIEQLDKYLKTNLEPIIQRKALIITKGKVDTERYRSLLVVLDKNKIHSVRTFTEY